MISTLILALGFYITYEEMKELKETTIIQRINHDETKL